jgi:hypothetical protein
MEQTSGRKSIFDKDEDCLLSTELDSLAHHINKLAHCQISRYKVPILYKDLE